MTEIITESKSYTLRREQWRKIRDALEGEDQVKLRGTTYLPQPSGMTREEFNNYKQRAMFYSVAERTRRGMLGLVFRQDPIVKVPEKMKAWMKNMTSEGNSFEMFSDELLGEVLTVGRYGVLPDFSTNAKPNEFPHLVIYKAEDISDWKQEIKNGKKVTTYVLLRDTVESHLDTGEEEYLELKLIDDVYTAQRWKLVTKTGGSGQMRVNLGDPVIPTVRGKPLNYIPFFFVNPYDMKPEVAKPPFLDLVNMNMAHYRNSADYEHALYMTAQPTPWVAGVVSESMKPTTIGPNVIWYLAENGRAGYLEFEGKGLEEQRTAMQHKEDRMAALGARMIAESANRNETVDTARLRGRGEMSLLKSVVSISSVAVTRIVQLVADWMGIAGEVSIEYNDDFVETRMTHQEILAMVSAWQSGAISRETLHENFQRGEIVSPTKTVEEEVASIEADTMRVQPEPVPGDEEDDQIEEPEEDNEPPPQS